MFRNSLFHEMEIADTMFWFLGRKGPNFVKKNSKLKSKYTEVDLVNIFLYSYEAEFIQSLLSAGKKQLASQFNFTYRYIDLSINYLDFDYYLGQMYPAELEIKDTNESIISVFCLDLLLSIGRDGQLRTSLYNKRADFNSHVTNFPFLSSNIPSSPAYGVFISQRIRYERACSSYECFIQRAGRFSCKLLGQGYVREHLKSLLKKFYGRHGFLITHYGVSLCQMVHDILGHGHICDTLHLSDKSQNRDLVTELGLLAVF